MDRIEADHRRIINGHASHLSRQEDQLNTIEETSNAIGAGLNLAVSRIDADLRELDDRVTRRRRECESNEVTIDLCQGRISELERILKIQAQTIARLEERIEEVACKCCAGSKGKGKERAVVPESPILGSPILLAPSSDREESSDSSYVTPPLAARSSPVVASLQLVKEDSDVLVRPPGIGWPSTQQALEIEDEDLSFYRGMAALARNVQGHLGVVRGQRAHRSLGPPKHLFDPYPTVRRFLESSKRVRPGESGADVGRDRGKESGV